MKKHLISFSVLLFAQQSSMAQSGNLDSSFGKYGIVSTDFLKRDDKITKIAIQNDGKIVAGGIALNSFDEFALARYQKNGNLDSSFGTYGKVRTDIGIEHDEATSMIIQTDGKIVLAGYSPVYKPFDYKSDFILARYKTNGNLDSSFGVNGKVSNVIGLGVAQIFAMAQQADGKIVVVGGSANATAGNLVVARYKTNGTPDSTFNGTGIVITDFSTGGAGGSGVQIQKDGKIVISGGVSIGKMPSFLLARYLSNGSLDNTFGSSGIVASSIGTIDDGFGKCLLQSDGKILVIGCSWEDVALIKRTFYIMRYLTNGTLDNTFGTGGRVPLSFGIKAEFLTDIALQTDGKIVATVKIPAHDSYPSDDIGLARFNTNGTLDTTFGTKGKIVTVIGATGTSAHPSSVAIQTDNKIVVGGYTADPSATETNFMLLRYLSTPSLGILNLSGTHPLLFYPNPVQEHTFLEYTLEREERISIVITDIQGHIISSPLIQQLQHAGNYKQPIALAQDLPAGNYFLTLSSENGQQIIKIVK